jgi:hypothetical protein
MWHRPWRWIMALLGAVVVMALVNLTAQGLGFSEFFGSPRLIRAGALVALTVLFTTLVVPSAEKMEAGDPLPPLPSGQQRTREPSS